MSLAELGRSEHLIGSAEVFNGAPWLAKFVQFFISWAVIIGFLMYYFSYLCTLVFLSNKEFFRSVDEIKKGGESSDGNRISIKGFIAAFRSSNGGETKKRLTGIDNIVMFVMMLSPNFLAYSRYANVEPGETKEGQRFNHEDTMGQFFLKSLPESVLILFILGMALSGLLLRILFQLSDVLTVQAEKFANTNLQLWVERITPDRDNFWFGNRGEPLGDIANKVARDAMNQIRAYVPNLDDDIMLSIVAAIEAEVAENLFVDNALDNPAKFITGVEKSNSGIANNPHWVTLKPLITGGQSDYSHRVYWSGFEVRTVAKLTVDENVAFAINMQETAAGKGALINMRQPILNVRLTYNTNQAYNTGASNAGGTAAPIRWDDPNFANAEDGAPCIKDHSGTTGRVKIVDNARTCE